MIVGMLLTDWDHGGMMDGGNGWRWLIGFGMLVVLIAALVLVVWAITRATMANAAPAPRDPNLSARQILGERLARGEIDPAEYQERLSHLGP
jgi:putative membrane protein